VTKRGDGSGAQNKMRWHCVCACGRKKQVFGDTLRSGRSKSCGCLTVESARSRGGKSSPCWKGGKWKTKDGYIRLRLGIGTSPQPTALEHRIVMEKHLGRNILETETVHHKNGVRHDNRIENLELRVGSHKEGLTIKEAVQWATQILQRYSPKALR
jgi:hypothetical protein